MKTFERHRATIQNNIAEFNAKCVYLKLVPYFERIHSDSYVFGGVPTLHPISMLDFSTIDYLPYNKRYVESYTYINCTMNIRHVLLLHLFVIVSQLNNNSLPHDASSFNAHIQYKDLKEKRKLVSKIPIVTIDS